MKNKNQKVLRAKAPMQHVIPVTQSFPKYHRGQIADAILSAYSNVFGAYTMKPRPPKFDTSVVLSNTPQCLGDFMTLTNLPWVAKQQGTIRYTWSPRTDGHYLLSTYVPEWVFPENRLWFTDGQFFIYNYYCGNGHLMQKWCRAFGLHAPAKPQPRLVIPGPSPKYKDRVILHFEASANHRKRQRDEFRFHPRPRELYDSSKFVIEQFVKRHSHLEFVEVGHQSRGLRGVQHIPTATTEDLFKLIATGSWFIGVLSGPLHVATAFGLNVITIVNFPHASQIVLPVLKSTGVPEEEWLYPQNVVLHQDEGSKLVPKLSLTSLEAAFDGMVYPYYEDSWLDLIYEEKYAEIL